MRQGKLQVQGDIAGDCWEKIYSSIIGENEGIGGAYDKVVAEFNGADAATAYTDLLGNVFTFVGTAQLDTAQKKFGSASLLCDGDDYVTLPDSDNWNLGSGNFTIDCQVRISTLPGQDDFHTVWGQYSATGWDRYRLFLIQYSSNPGHYYWRFNVIDNGVETFSFERETTVAINTWYHVAVVRNGNSWMIFQDGTLLGSAESASITIPDVAGLFNIGSTSDQASQGWNGWIDEFRLSKGIAKWTENFTPPTAAYGVTSLTISSLAGNTDKEYKLICRFVNGYNGASSYYLRPNNNSGSNYGRQLLYGTSTTITATRNTSLTGFPIGYITTLNYLQQLEFILYAKSGFIRTAINKLAYSITGTTIIIAIDGNSWNNSADEITSLVILADQTNGLGIGTSIELYKRVDK